jgi:hypothetical protein
MLMMETGSHSKEKTYRCMTDVLAICEFDDLLVEFMVLQNGVASFFRQTLFQP